jgi:hypothetical protein
MSALINIVFIAAAAFLTKKKPCPLLCGLGFGLIKAILSFLAIPTLMNTLFVAVLFAATGTAFFFLLERLGKKPHPADDPSTAYTAAGQKGGKFYWEYIPFAVLALFFLAGEFLLSSMTIVIG